MAGTGRFTFVRSNPLGRLLWAVDPFDVSHSLIEAATAFFHALAQSSRPIVTPVYVLIPRELGADIENPMPYQPDLMLERRSEALRALEQLARQTRYPRMDPPKVLLGRAFTGAGAARMLSQFAREAEVDAILTLTHGRTGLRRMLLGSFSENLLQLADPPVITIGPGSRNVREFREILFPVEPGRTTLSAFRRGVGLAGALGAELALFHSVPHPLVSLVQSGVYLFSGGILPAVAGIDEPVRRSRHRLELWARWACTQGVPTSALVDVQGDSASETILSLARERRSSLILMETRAGPVSAALVGSVTRSVARHAPCPVWAFHPRSAWTRTVPVGRRPRAA